MRYYKQIANGYVSAIGIDVGGVEISEAEYNNILNTIRNKPVEPGRGFRLTASMEWEGYELPAPDPDPELTAEEIVEILLGGA